MSAARLKRTIGLIAGALLLCIGALGMWISKSSYDNPAVQKFCDVWLCPEEFSPQRVFQVGQMAALGDAPGQLRDFWRALLADSASAYRWADLADSEFNVRDLSKARYAYGRALAAGPRSPVILMRAANFYFGAGDYQETVRELSKILRDPGLSDYYDTVFLTYSRLGMSLADILNQGSPAKTTAGTSFLRFWIKLGRAAEAQQTWEWLVARKSVDESAASVYTNFLLAKHENAMAQSTWQSFTSRDMPDYAKTNWIFNGGFEAPFEGSLLDWQIAPTSGITVERVKGQAVSGEWSLHMSFHADDNLDYRQTVQRVFLPPGKWQFSAMVKTRDVTTDEGPHFHLADFQDPANLEVWTQPQNGTADWQKTTAAFQVSAATGLIGVEIVRSPSSHFDNKITGEAWIDDVAIARAK